jgi:hypothetical protein
MFAVPVQAPNVCPRVLKIRVNENGTHSIFQNTLCDSVRVSFDSAGQVHVMLCGPKASISERNMFLTALPHSSGYDYLKFRGLRTRDGFQSVWMELCRNGTCVFYDFFLSIEVF